jgi:4a-hydroxytetrahydrobiopterin dehydratase
MFSSHDNLKNKHCVPCEGGVPPLPQEDVRRYLFKLRGGWEAADNKKIRREFKFKNFRDAMNFANRIAEIAERENHHPDLHVSYGKVAVELTTHALSGLSENDFILAAKIDALNKG